MSNNIHGIIQVGANIGQECGEWKRQGIKNQLYFEPIPEAFNRLLNDSADPNFNVHCYQLALSDKNGVFPFWHGREHGNSSFFQLSPTRPSAHHHNIHSHQILVPTMTLDYFFAVFAQDVKVEDYNFLFLDVQGGELDVLKGATSTLQHIQYIQTEVSYETIYQAPLFEEVNAYILSQGFRLLANNASGGNPNQGEAHYGR